MGGGSTEHEHEFVDDGTDTDCAMCSCGFMLHNGMIWRPVK